MWPYGRKDKTPFWNLLHIAPVRSNAGKVILFPVDNLLPSSFSLNGRLVVRGHVKVGMGVGTSLGPNVIVQLPRPPSHGS